MKYTVEFKPQALKDCKKLPKSQVKRIFERIGCLQEDLTGDVKRLTDFTPEYRLRVGTYRVLFEIEGQKVIIYRVVHRKDAYK